MEERIESRLCDECVGELANFLEEKTKTCTGKTYHSYPLHRVRDSRYTPQIARELGVSYPVARELGIMRVADYPAPGLRTAVSFGLAHESFTAYDFPDRIEFLTTWDSEDEFLERLVRVVSEIIMMRGRPPKPGAIYVDAMKMAELTGLAARMPHGLVMFPFKWSDGCWDKAMLPHARVWFLQAVPIYEAESEFISRNGFSTFKELLSYDVFDLHHMNRASHVE